MTKLTLQAVLAQLGPAERRFLRRLLRQRNAWVGSWAWFPWAQPMVKASLAPGETILPEFQLLGTYFSRLHRQDFVGGTVSPSPELWRGFGLKSAPGFAT
jgi:hypothetical protein